MTRRLRYVVFSPSIVSDFGNPQATTVRAMCAALIELGHEVIHCEERRNESFLAMLANRRAAPLRTFNRNYPLLTYRQFEVVHGNTRRVWFSREIGTADVVVAYPGTEPGADEEIRELASERTLSMYPGAVSVPIEIQDAWFEPAVLPDSDLPSPPAASPLGRGDDVEPIASRQGTIAVAYDNVVTAFDDVKRFTAGSFADDGWQPVSELNLPSIYADASEVWLAEDDCRGPAFARAFLPVASGAISRLVDSSGKNIRTIDSVLEGNDARFRASRITTYVESVLTERYVLPNQ